MGASGKRLNISSVVAALCIAVYIGAISFGMVRIIVGIGERRNLAEMEFYDLADRASSAAVSLGFMSEAYQESIRDFFNISETILGIIITGSSGEYAFERSPGSGIVWASDSPRFRPRFPAEPFYLPLRIEGQRNVTIQAVYSYINHDLFLRVLRNTLLAVLSALAVAFITLLLELIQKNRAGYYRSGATAASESNLKDEPDHEAAYNETAYELDDMFFSEETGDTDTTFENTEFPEIPEMDDPRSPEEDETPQGLYTPRANIGWESYTHDRLKSELHRCASFEQDLAFLVMELDEINSDSLYRQFADEAVDFFSMRDLVFEKGEKGISVIIPSIDLEDGINKSHEFCKRILAKLPESFTGRAGLRIGLSSRSGRLIDAKRLILEASTALEKTLEEPPSQVVAFRSDPEKYREFIRNSD